MQLVNLLASTEDTAHSHSLLDAFPHMAGMLVVMVTLAFLWGICAITAAVVKSLQSTPKTADLPPAPVPAPAPAQVQAPAAAQAPAPAPAPFPETSGIPPEIVAVIAAAVATVTGRKPVRIVSIKPMSTSWERAGRQSVLTSHRIR